MDAIHESLFGGHDRMTEITTGVSERARVTSSTRRFHKKGRYCRRCVIWRDPTFAKFANIYRGGVVSGAYTGRANGGVWVNLDEAGAISYLVIKAGDRWALCTWPRVRADSAMERSVEMGIDR